MANLDPQAIAAEILGAARAGRQIQPLAARTPGLDLGLAYRVTAVMRQLRELDGERAIGRKIGFTNRTIWDEYGVHAPIWGHIYDRTLVEIAELGEGFPLQGLLEPRIEPEIVFGLESAPRPGMDERDLLACIEWVAHGFEIVQSLYPAWEFTAADTIAAFGLHGALLLGPRLKLGPERGALLEPLRSFEIELRKNGRPADRGKAANVLDGPLPALRHLVALLAEDPANEPLAPGEIVTTGTLTRAFPVTRGERWSTSITGLPLAGIAVDFI